MANTLPLDTDARSQDVQNRIYAGLTGAQRLAIAFRLTATARQLTMAGIRRRHPGYTDDEVRLALMRIIHGDDLVRKVWPGRPLVEP